MSGRYSARGVDKDPGWVERRFREQDQRLAELSSGKLSAVPGSVVTIQQILTDPASMLGFVNTDSVTATGVGDTSVALTYLPILGSVHVAWNGVEQEPADWSISDYTLTLVDPNGWIESGDVITVRYAYDPQAAPFEFPGLDWGSTGPNLIVAEGDTTDYSAPGFDDSGWTEAAAPVGFPLTAVPAVSWPVAVTTSASVDSGFWLRRTVTAPSGGIDVIVSARADGQYWLYVDGVLIDSYTGATPDTYEPAIAHTLTGGVHVIALHVNDDTSDVGSDWVYGDLAVTAA